jgi:hypothetical protein
MLWLLLGPFDEIESVPLVTGDRSAKEVSAKTRKDWVVLHGAMKAAVGVAAV